MLLPFLKKRPLMKRDRISVAAEGADVVVKFGTTEVVLPYETALDLSNWMRVRAKEAKAFTGDDSRKFNVIGVLRDGEQTRG